MDRNHQKIPYFSGPPTIPTIAGRSAAVAPGAETVGQGQILTEISKPFELAGLFGVADEGAFVSDEVKMGDNTPP